MKMEESSEWVIIARFGRPHGVKGFVSIISFTEPVENIFLYSNWHIYKDNQWNSINVLASQTNSDRMLVQIEGYNYREEAALLTNLEIAVPREDLPALDSGEYYWHDLLGLQVVNSNGKVLGEIIELIPTGSNDVLVVQGEKKHLLPYLPGQVVLEVDKSKKTMRVDWEEDF